MSYLRQSYRRYRYGEPVVVVSGLPRSGTSMVMGMLEAGGLPPLVDGLRTPDEDNPKGYYELERVKDLGETEDKSWMREARGKAIKVISYLLKDLPRDCNYRVLFMGRDLREILASQAKMLERRGEAPGIGDDRMVELYEDHLWKVDHLLRGQPHLQSLDVDYAAVIDHPRQEARRIRDFLELPLDVEKMAGVVDRALYRNRG